MVLSGTRMPMVLRRGCCKRRGTSWVACRMKVNDPGVAALSNRKRLVVHLGVGGDFRQIRGHTRVKL